MRGEIQGVMDRLNQELSPQFEVIRGIGEGKTARVFLAKEPALRRMVAIKGPTASTRSARLFPSTYCMTR